MRKKNKGGKKNQEKKERIGTQFSYYRYFCPRSFAQEKPHFFLYHIIRKRFRIVPEFLICVK